jgi:hypothetical protein
MSKFLDQLFPPSPTFTENSLPSLSNRVYLITGGNAGVGFEFARILYLKGATVYIACRSESKTNIAISSITSPPSSSPPSCYPSWSEPQNWPPPLRAASASSSHPPPSLIPPSVRPGASASLSSPRLQPPNPGCPTTPCRKRGTGCSRWSSLKECTKSPGSSV